MHHGCVAGANGGGEGSGGVVADIAKLSVGREEYYTRELATDHEQYLSGHGESPGRWYGAGAAGLGLAARLALVGEVVDVDAASVPIAFSLWAARRAQAPSPGPAGGVLGRGCSDPGFCWRGGSAAVAGAPPGCHRPGRWG
jgi:hypothetical protein